MYQAKWKDRTFSITSNTMRSYLGTYGPLLLQGGIPNRIKHN